MIAILMLLPFFLLLFGPYIAVVVSALIDTKPGYKEISEEEEYKIMAKYWGMDTPYEGKKNMPAPKKPKVDPRTAALNWIEKNSGLITDLTAPSFENERHFKITKEQLSGTDQPTRQQIAIILQEIYVRIIDEIIADSTTGEINGVMGNG